MLKKRIIPCLDVKAGRVVKGVKFEDLRDMGDPAELAARYYEEGADEVAFLDIGASKEERATTLDVVRQTAERLFIPLTVGGGIRTVEDVQAALTAGADKVSMNTAALLRPQLIVEAAARFGSQCIVVAIDAKRVARGDPLGGEEDAGEGRVGIDAKTVGDGRWEVFTHGGSKATGKDAVAWAREATALGAGEILLTSMDRDGTRDGFDVGLTRAVSEAAGIPVIASGGAGRIEHFFEALTDGHADAALAASLFHERSLAVDEVKRYLAGRGVRVRPEGF